MVTLSGSMGTAPPGAGVQTAPSQAQTVAAEADSPRGTTARRGALGVRAAAMATGPGAGSDPAAARRHADPVHSQVSTRRGAPAPSPGGTSQQEVTRTTVRRLQSVAMASTTDPGGGELPSAGVQV